MELQQSLTHLATLQTIVLTAIFLAGLAMGLWSVLELRDMRPMLYVQTRAEHHAAMTRAGVRRVL